MATELGKAYVQIMPSAKGISGKIQSAIDPEATSAGKSAGSKIGSLIKGAIVAAGIGAVIKSAISEGAELEQSIGGIETLFKGTADIVRKQADEAFRTTGLSANEYMQNVTGFSASLLQSLGGDTQKAAKISNRAMIDMADNSNKMGTNMQDIQNAYQGFAKQNYTMLDNLKLGYGGTKKEMDRLLKDATKLSGVKYNIDNLSDVYTAIGVVQDQLGITGTTALEAEETLSGSLNAMKSSFKNLLGNLALGNDIKPSLEALASTVSTFLFKNMLPMFVNLLAALPQLIISFITEAIPMLIEQGMILLQSIGQGITNELPSMLLTGTELINNFVNGILAELPNVFNTMSQMLGGLLEMIFEFIPTIIDAGISVIANFAKGLLDNAPAIIDSMISLIKNLLDIILENYPEYFKKGREIVVNIAKGIWNNLPQILSTVVDLILKLINTFISYLPKFLAMGGKLLVEMGIGLINAVPGFIAFIPSIISSILTEFGKLVTGIFDIGGNIVKGLWNGIKSVKNWILEKIGGFVGDVVGGIKSFFGIKSPSRVMANEIGKFLPSGIALGIEANTQPLTKTMEDLSSLTVDSFDSDLSMTSTLNSSDVQGDKLSSMISLMTEFINSPPNYQMVMDNGVLVGEMAPTIDRKLSDMEESKRRGGS